jgi:hypothetical protein
MVETQRPTEKMRREAPWCLLQAGQLARLKRRSDLTHYRLAHLGTRYEWPNSDRWKVITAPVPDTCKTLFVTLS